MADMKTPSLTTFVRHADGTIEALDRDRLEEIDRYGALTGIYGMNFVFMPELEWALGYPFALGLMALAVVGAVTLFRVRGWF